MALSPEPREDQSPGLDLLSGALVSLIRADDADQVEREPT
jgi:hypothetical protein